jgi:hypothetical protein
VDQQSVKATQQPIYQPPVEEVQQHHPVLGVQATVKWSEEFTHLQHLIKENKATLSLKKSRILGGQHFFLWLYWDCETRPSILNLFGKSFIFLHWVLLNELVWLALSIVLAILINWFFLLCILVPVIIKALLNPIGQGFMIYDARNNEDLFDDLWQNQEICIMSVKRHESPIHKDGVPDIIIEPYNQNWREKISKAKF